MSHTILSSLPFLENVFIKLNTFLFSSKTRKNVLLVHFTEDKIYLGGGGNFVRMRSKIRYHSEIQELEN